MTTFVMDSACKFDDPRLAFFAAIDMQLRHYLVGTALGDSLVYARQLWKAWRVITRCPERGGLICQEAIAQRLLPRLCSPGCTFVDVGAHIGSIVASALRHHRGSQVVAIEAIPAKAEHLRRRFPTIAVINVAASDSDDVATFYVDMQQSGYSSLIRPHASTVLPITVQMKRLDDVISGAVNVGVLKIDVEGAEIRVLRGGGALIDRCRPTIMFESARPPTDATHSQSLEVFDWLVRREYEILVPNRVAHEGPGLAPETFIEGHYYPRRTTNYFAVPIERREQVRAMARLALSRTRAD